MEATERQRIVDAVTLQAEKIKEEEIIRRCQETAFLYWFERRFLSVNDLYLLKEMGITL